MSLELALILDRRKDIFVDLLESIDSRKLFCDHWNEFKKQVSSGLFNQGFEAKILKFLNDSVNDYLLSKPGNNQALRTELQRRLEAIFLWSQRTVDTVKHQAKTITVGAVRDDNSPQALGDLIETKVYEPRNRIGIDQFLLEVKSRFSRINFDEMSRCDEVLVSCEGLDEACGYNLLNIVNETSKKIDGNIFFRLAQPYDLQPSATTTNKFWLRLIYENSVSSADSDQLGLIDNSYTIDIGDLASKTSILCPFNLHENTPLEVQQALLSTIAGVQISHDLISHSKAVNEVTFDNLSRFQHEMADALVQLSAHFSFLQKSDEFQRQISYAARMFLSRKNLKCLGSGTNYNAAKSVSKSIIKSIKRACAHDVLENHKHIDMSAESAVLTLIANIWKPGYQQDAQSEIEKMLAHSALPIVLTNVGDMRFDAQNFSTFEPNGKKSFLQVPIVKIPSVSELFSFPLHKFVLASFVNELEFVLESSDDNQDLAALFLNQKLKLDLNVR